MIDRIKKLSDITFQPKAVSGVILAHDSAHLLNTFYTAVRTFADPTRKGVGNKYRLKKWCEYTYNRVMEDSVSNSGFVDMPLFRVGNVETTVRSVFVRFIFQISVECENVLLQIPLKLQDILFLALVSAKSFPSDKQAFGGNY